LSGIAVALHNRGTAHRRTNAYSARGTDQERNEALKIISRCRNFLAGSRLTVEDNVQTEPIEYQGTRRYQMNRDGIWYALKISVGTLVQFNAE